MLGQSDAGGGPEGEEGGSGTVPGLHPLSAGARVAPSRGRPKQGFASPNSAHVPRRASPERVCEERLVISADGSVLI